MDETNSVHIAMPLSLRQPIENPLPNTAQVARHGEFPLPFTFVKQLKE